MGTLVALRQLRCTKFKTIHGEVIVDQVETKVPQLLRDIKGTREVKTAAVQLLLAYLRFLNVDQKSQVLASLVDILKNDGIELKGHAAAVLEMLIDHDNIHKLIYEYNVIQLLAGMLGSAATQKKFAYRSLYNISKFQHSFAKFERNGILNHAITELQRDHTQICSDTCVMLVGSLASDALYASQLLTNGGLTVLLNLLRTPTTTPPKLIPPAIRALRDIALHDDVKLKAVLQAGAVQLIAGVLNTRYSPLHPRMQIDAALILCELATTKNPEIQDLIVRASFGDTLAACLRHPSMEVKHAATRTLEHWMYADEQAMLYGLEFFLTLANSGAQVAPNVKELLSSMKIPVKPKPEPNPIAALVADIKTRPESSNDEVRKLKRENQRLLASIAAQQAYTKNLETSLARFVGGSTTLSTSSSTTTSTTTTTTLCASPSKATELDLTRMRNMDELNKVEEKIQQQRNSIVTELQDKLVCPLCMDKPRQSNLQPCGHLLCEDCAKKILTKRECPFCRAKINSIGKVFL